jgi:uncharacterized protein
MPQQPVIDGFEFAESGGVLKGELPVLDFPRLHDVLREYAGEIRYVVSGKRDREGRPALRIELRGTLSLNCQRCLQPLDFPVALDTVLTLARSQFEGDADPADSNIERVVASEEMAVRDLLEDELLLSVPFAPRHASCTIRGIGSTEGSSPFATLRGLLGHDSPGGRNN